nr:hypothetical protein [Tanacetum cinerariifolium]
LADPEAPAVVETPAAIGVAAGIEEATETEVTVGMGSPAAMVEPTKADVVSCNSAGCVVL